MSFHDASEVEHVAGLHRGAAVVDLLCDDLAGGLEQNVSAAYLRTHGRVAGQAADAIKSISPTFSKTILNVRYPSDS